MSNTVPATSEAAVSTQLNAIFVSLELSRSTWLVTSLSPGAGNRMSRHAVKGGDLPGLMKLFAQLRTKARTRKGEDYTLVVIQEAGLDGFWIHRCLEREGVESHVVDEASIAASRKSRRAKTDKLDGEALIRALLAYKRGEPRVCSMVAVPTVEDEDRRRICREQADSRFFLDGNLSLEAERRAAFGCLKSMSVLPQWVETGISA